MNGMVYSGSLIPPNVFAKRLQRLVFLRALFAFFLLGLSLFAQFRGIPQFFGEIVLFHYIIIIFILLSTLVFYFIQKYSKQYVQIAYIQLLLDTLIITIIIFATGGIESPFSFFYILVIITASIILYRRGGMIIASSSGILYGLLLDLHFYGVIEPIGSNIQYIIEYQNTYIFFLITTNIAAFYLVAFLSSYPSEQERKSRFELQAVQDDIVKLEILNERIIHNITSGLLTVDNLNRIILFNPAAEEIFNTSAREAIGRNVLEILPFLVPYLKKESGNTEEKAKRSSAFIDVPYARNDGKTLYLRFTISTLDFPDGKQRGWILVFQDMTDMRQIEEEMKKVEGLAMVGELAAGIAHEIRNPMASISGSIQMLKEGLVREDVNSRLMDIIMREISRLNHLVNDFLMFARPKQVDKQEFDINQVILESLDLFRNSERWDERIRIRTELKGTLLIPSDAAKIKQILWNLFINAREAMPEGGLLRISTNLDEDAEQARQGPKQLTLCIRDTGKGFTDEALYHLFTPFYTTKESGSGLGLAIVKRIVEGLGGKIFGRNHPEGGAEITVTFPLDSQCKV